LRLLKRSGISYNKTFPVAIHGECWGLLNAYKTTTGVANAAAICMVLVFTESTSGALLMRVTNSSKDNKPAVFNDC